MTKLLISLICVIPLAAQTKVDWVTQMKNPPMFDVRTYGAKGDGVANDTVAIGKAMDAVKAKGGGSVFFPKGTYRFVMTSTGFNQNTVTFTKEASNITIFGQGDGSVIQFESPIGEGFKLANLRAGFNVFCTTLLPFNCDTAAPAWGFPVVKRFNSAVAGARSITMTTASDASVFSAGMDVWLESGDAGPDTGHPSGHFEYNTVVSANSSTGVVTLASILGDSYDSTDTAWPPSIAIMTTLPKNITIRDLKLTTTFGASGVLVHLGSVRNVTFDHCTFVGLGDATVWYNQYTEGLTIRNSVFDNMTSDLGDNGYNFVLENNVFKNSPAPAIQASAGIRDYRIVGNHIWLSSTACCANAINVTGQVAYYPSRKVEISGNHIQMADKQAGVGVQVSLMDSGLITGNTITGTGQAGGFMIGVSARASANTRITNNMVNIAAGGWGVYVGDTDGPASGNVITGNTLNVDSYGIFLDGAPAGTIIGCNQFLRASTNVRDTNPNSTTIYQCVPPATYYASDGTVTATVTSIANHTFCGIFTVPGVLRVGHIGVAIDTGDGAARTDVGIYSADGAMIAHTGPVMMGSPGVISQPFSGGGTYNIPAGKLYHCFTSESSTLKMSVYGSAASLMPIRDMGATTSGGVLPGAVSAFSGLSIGAYPVVVLMP